MTNKDNLLNLDLVTGKVVAIMRTIEFKLKDCGGIGQGIKELSDSLYYVLESDDIEKIKFCNKIRNKLVHVGEDGYYHIPTDAEYEKFCIYSKEIITRLNKIKSNLEQEYPTIVRKEKTEPKIIYKKKIKVIENNLEQVILSDEANLTNDAEYSNNSEMANKNCVYNDIKSNPYLREKIKLNGKDLDEESYIDSLIKDLDEVWKKSSLGGKIISALGVIVSLPFVAAGFISLKKN